jgi:hypothetical protein
VVAAAVTAVAVAAAAVVVVTAVAVAATKKTLLADLSGRQRQNKGAPGLLFSCLRGIATTVGIAACFFRKSVAHNEPAGFPPLKVCGDPSVSR